MKYFHAASIAFLGELLPAPDRPLVELEASVERFGKRLPLDMAVHAADGALLAAAGRALPSPPGEGRESRWTHSRGRGPVAAISLSDGRWVMVRVRHKPSGMGLLVGLSVMFLAIAVGAYPLVRRLTRRIERLQNRVDALGSGDLSARVEIEGKDEVAELARRFNRAADHIERLVNAQKTVLRGVSHELRTPLTRMRMAVELLHEGSRPELLRRLSEAARFWDRL